MSILRVIFKLRFTLPFDIFPNIDNYYKYLYDGIDNNKYMPNFFDFISDFYRSINLNPIIYYDFFYIPISSEILNLYNNISSVNLPVKRLQNIKINYRSF